MEIISSYLLILPAIVIAVVAHEYSKAFISTKLGDELPKAKGRLSLNPAKHLEPIGFIFMLATGFGWGQPTPTSALHYTNRKRDTVLTYTLPSVLNLLIGFIFAGLNALYLKEINLDISAEQSGYISAFLFACARININMALFNILPVYPMDGAKVLSVFLHPATVVRMAQYEKILQMLLMVLVFAGVIGTIFQPVLSLLLLPFAL